MCIEDAAFLNHQECTLRSQKRGIDLFGIKLIPYMIKVIVIYFCFFHICKHWVHFLYDSAIVISVTFLNLRDKGSVPSQYVFVCLLSSYGPSFSVTDFF